MEKKSDEREKPTNKNIQLNKDVIHGQWANKKLYRQAKGKSIQHHQISLAPPERCWAETHKLQNNYTKEILALLRKF